MKKVLKFLSPVVIFAVIAFVGLAQYANAVVIKPHDDDKTFLEVTCDSVVTNGNTWTVSGTWTAYNFEGQSTQYDTAIASPSGTFVDDSSKDSPDIFTIVNGPSDYADDTTPPNKDDMDGTWSNQIIFGSTPASISAALYHGKTGGNEISPDSTCSFTLPPQCNNGIDDDNDGFIDFAGGDPGCTDASDNDETNIPPVNAVPVAVADSYSTNEDTALNVSASGVLTNDTDADSDPLTAIKVTDPANGSVVLNSDGSFTYTPNADFNGSDSFTYKANDGTADSNIATVTITVNSVNDAPVAVADSYSTNEDTPLVVAVSGVLGNDSDVDGDSLSAIKVTDPSNGSVLLNSDGSFTYTPNTNFNGSDSFTYKANDGTVDSNTVIVSITVNPVNNAPVAVDDSASTNEDTLVTTGDVLSNDTDVDGDTLSVSVADATSANGGTVVNNGNGTFNYTPASNFNGTDTFNYTVSDGSLTDVGTVTITVTAVNDAPVANNDAYSANEDTALNVAASGVLGNDTDVEGNTLTSILVSNVSHGTLTLNSDGSFNYAPASNYVGPDSFTYKANDGSADSNTATVNITVGGTNDIPVASNDSYSTYENVALVISAPGVLGNDTDADSDPLTAVKVTDPSHGTVTLNSDGSFTYTPTSNFSGTDSFTYKANDGTADSGTAVVTITVNRVATDVCPNITGFQTTVPRGKHLNNSGDCVNNTSGGGLTGGRAGGGTPQGQVLGASTEICTAVESYMRRGHKNDMAQVKIVQGFLNTYMKWIPALVIDGLYGPKTEAAVKAFQLARKDNVLTPWHLTVPTGIFYKTSLAEAKRLMCPDQFGNLPIPTDLIPWSQNPTQVPPAI